jgi:hypothetical protein
VNAVHPEVSPIRLLVAFLATPIAIAASFGGVLMALARY